MVCSPKHSLSSAGLMASFKSCLFANTSSAAPDRCSWPSKLKSSFCKQNTKAYGRGQVSSQQRTSTAGPYSAIANALSSHEQNAEHAKIPLLSQHALCQCCLPPESQHVLLCNKSAKMVVSLPALPNPIPLPRRCCVSSKAQNTSTTYDGKAMPLPQIANS